MNGYLKPEQVQEIGFAEVGSDVLISDKACFYGASKMRIGNHVRIDDFCLLIGNITIGNYVHLAPYASIHGTGDSSVELMDFSGLSSYATIYAASDDYSGAALTNPMVSAEFTMVHSSRVYLGKHAVVGLHSVLLPGSYLAEGSALGAMSLLTKGTEPWGIYVGIPCKKLKDRKKDLLIMEQRFLNKVQLEE